MTGMFFFLISLVFILFQTVVWPCHDWFLYSFDVNLVLVLFLSVSMARYAALAVIVLIGGMMDSISGAPFFLYLFSYVWVHLIVLLFKQVVFHTSGLSVLVVSVVAMLIQQGLIVFSVFIGQGQAGVLQIDFSRMAWQIAWGAMLIPTGVWGISVFYQNWLYMGRLLKKYWEHRTRD